jgi:hypothetical protein
MFQQTYSRCNMCRPFHALDTIPYAHLQRNKAPRASNGIALDSFQRLGSR